jgi:hypothetical protein
MTREQLSRLDRFHRVFAVASIALELTFAHFGGGEPHGFVALRAIGRRTDFGHDNTPLNQAGAQSSQSPVDTVMRR